MEKDCYKRDSPITTSFGLSLKIQDLENIKLNLKRENNQSYLEMHTNYKD
jgi:hypothetical protein